VPVLLWKRRDGKADMFVGVPSDGQLRSLIADLA
jgi:hypothetical protein